MGETTRAKRGELAELSASLQNLCTAGKRTDRELRTAKKEVFKKVINYMTLGMDMSPLFPMMTSCANLSADDLVLKKMLYLYITHYATHTPDLALLAINQLHKDCNDQDPTVRGLALRSLCSLRVPNFLEYVVAPINVGLEDRHPYVRRTAALGVLKVYHIDASIVLHQGMLDRVKRMLYNDPDTQVIANCLHVMMTVEGAQRLAEKALVYSLLNRIKEFSDWSQCAVLEVTAHYGPSSEEEVYDVLNVLEDRLSHVNSAIVMATIKVFLHHTLNMTATHQQVLERIKDPLKTLISKDDAAMNFAVLSHVLVLVSRAPIIFEQDYVSFYCRTHDPWYVKKLKMQILATIASSSNVYEIVTELTEYARDISPAMAREAIKAVGQIALSVPDVGGIIERLLTFLESGSEHIVAETLVQMKDLLRRYPDMAEVVIPQTDLDPTHVLEPKARAALVWIIGQFGHLIKDAPYLLEPLAESFSSEDAGVRLALLTAGASLLFKRPPEAQRLLGALLAAGVADGHQDVHDRALLYLRLLRVDPGEAERIISPPAVIQVNCFSEAQTPEVKDKIFEEFNTLSVVYQAPAASFVEKQAYHLMEDDIPESPAPAADLLAVEAPELLGDQSTNLLADVEGVESDLLDLDIGSLPSTSASQTSSSQQQPAGPGAGPTIASLSPLDSLAGLTLPPPVGVSPLLGGIGGVGTAGQGGLGGGLDNLLGSPSFAQPPASGGAALPGGGMVGFAGGAAGGLLGAGVGGGGLLQQPQLQPQLGMQPPAAAAPLGAGMGMGMGIGGPPANGSAPAASGSLLGGGGMMDDLLGGLGALAGGPAAPAAAAPPQPPQELRLNPQARITPAQFQGVWKTLTPLHQYTESLSPATTSAITASNHTEFTQHMMQAYIQTMASGGQAPAYKFYFYGQTAAAPQRLFLVEVLLNSATHSAAITLKAEAPELLPQFLELWSNCLMGFYR